MVIGRDPSCKLFFADHKISRRHARLEPLPEGVRLVDLGSRNGSWVNEEPVQERLLRPGDIIRLGGVQLEYEEDPRPERGRTEGNATLVLQGSESTVVLDGGPSSEEPEVRDRGPGGTAVVPGAAGAGDPDRTVVLPGASTAEPVEDSGTFVFEEEGKSDARTRRAPLVEEGRPSATSTESTLPETEPTPEREEVYWMASSGFRAHRLPETGRDLGRLVWTYGIWCGLVVSGVIVSLSLFAPAARWGFLALGWLMVGIGALLTSYLVRRASRSAVTRLEEDVEHVLEGRAERVSLDQSDEALIRVAERVNRLIQSQEAQRAQSPEAAQTPSDPHAPSYPQRSS